MFGLSRALTLALVAGVLALVLILAGPAACNKIRSLRAQAELQQGQSEALGNSARDAIATQGEAHRREAESEALTKSNEKEIRDAPGADDAVNPAVRDAGLRSLCRRAAYRDSERCRMFVPRASGVAPGS